MNQTEQPRSRKGCAESYARNGLQRIRPAGKAAALRRHPKACADPPIPHHLHGIPRANLIPPARITFTSSPKVIAMTTTTGRQYKDPLVYVTTSTYRDKYLANLVSGNHHLLMSALLMCYGYYVAGLSQYTSIKRYKYWCMCFVALTMPLARLCRTWIHKSSYDPFHRPPQRGYPRTDVQYLNAFTVTFPRANTFWKELGLAIHSIIAIMMSDSCQYYTFGISQAPVRLHSDGPSDMLSGEIFVDSSSVNAKHGYFANCSDLCCDAYLVVGPDDSHFKISYHQIIFGKNIGKAFLASLEASSSHLMSFLRDWGPSLQANLRSNKLPKDWVLEMFFGVQAARFDRRITFWRPGTKTLALQLAPDLRDSRTSQSDQLHLQKLLSKETTCSVISNRQGRVAHSALGPVSLRRLQMSTSLSERRQCNYTSIRGGLFIPPLNLGILKIMIGVCLPRPVFLTKALQLLSSSDPSFTQPLNGDATRIQKPRNKRGRASVCTAVHPDLYISFGVLSPYGNNTEVEFLNYHDPPPSSLGVSQIFLVKFMHKNYVATSTAAPTSFCNYFESFVAYVHDADIITLIPDFHPEPPLKSICPFGAPFPNLRHQSYVATSTVAPPTHPDYHNPPSTIQPIHGTTILHQEKCIELLFGLSCPYEGCDLETTSRKYAATRTVASSTFHNYPDPSAVFRTVSEIAFLQQHNCSSFLLGFFRDSRRSKSKFKHKLEHAPEPEPSPPTPDGGGPINRSARPFKPRPAPTRPSPPTPDGGGPNNVGLGIRTLFELMSEAITV